MSSFFSILEKLATLWISRSANSLSSLSDEKSRLVPAVVVTGAGSGIGFSLAKEFSVRGETLVLVGRQEGRLKIAARELSHKYGNRILTLALDIGQQDASEILIRWLSLEGLYCDILINNAAIGLSGPFILCEQKGLEELIVTNIKSLASLTRAFLPDMISRGRGGIINIGSLGGAIPGPWQALYYASKAFVLSFSEAIASEISGKGVRFCVVLPGPVETRFHARMGAEQARYRQFITGTTPEKVARSVMRGYSLGYRVIVPGILSKFAFILVRIAPHFLTVRLMNWLLSSTDSMKSEA